MELVNLAQEIVRVANKMDYAHLVLLDLIATSNAQNLTFSMTIPQ